MMGDSCWMMGDACGMTVVVAALVALVVGPDPNLKRKPSPVCNPPTRAKLTAVGP